MAVITLTTDWQNEDFYSGAVKGTILAINPDAKITDISHKISLFNSAQAAFILKNSYPYFPDGSIHILDVNSEASANQDYIVFRFNRHFFIGCNNGSLGYIVEDNEPDELVHIDIKDPSQCKTFPALSVFAPVAAEISKTGSLISIGSPLSKMEKFAPLIPTISDTVISGSVIYIDSYRNVITNVSKDLFDKIGKGRPFEILVQSYHYRITKINQTYNETANGELLAIFNSAKLLEIAINHGNVADLLNLGLNSNIRIKFQG
jgi:S-adenosylmethionine hydrolase